MAGFSGFTDEEISRLKLQGQSQNYGETERRQPAKKASLNSSTKRGKPREKIRTRPVQSSCETMPAKVKDRGVSSTSPAMSSTNEKLKEEEKQAEDQAKREKEGEVEVIMEPQRIKELELSNIEKMQQKQKEMEMINKKNEKILQDTVKQRYKKTQKEAETLKLVQKELSHLDNLLYTDVQILRDKIDDACHEFDAARKRYNKAEAEFINAKVNLHNKTEKKDQLMEHLCSIIQENEERKARKLAELMVKLEMNDQDLKKMEGSPEEHSEKSTTTVEDSTTNSCLTSKSQQPVEQTNSLAKNSSENNNISSVKLPVQSHTGTNNNLASTNTNEPISLDK